VRQVGHSCTGTLLCMRSLYSASIDDSEP
jgi:hypothetical protein